GRAWGVSTGYPDLDNLTGGLQPRTLTILAARPSMGKTTLAINIGQFVADRYAMPVAVFSLEQSAQELVQRMACAEARVDWRYLRNGEVSDFDLRRFEAAAEKIAALPIFICDRTDLSSRDMVARMRRLQQRHGKLGAVLVDYVQIAHERGSHG